LDELTFSLGPNEIGGPVETPNGWHLVKVQDVDEAVYADIDEQRTRHMTRRMMIKERLNAYVVGLREESFPVKVYEDKLSYHMQKEVDWYKIKSETGTQPPEKVYQEIDKLRGVK
jgi:parvulin-like peptidyl-prolyl isomerase